MRKSLSELQTFHWRLWIALCALALIPAVYQTVKTFLISSGGPAGAFDIIGQMEWFDLINETIQAVLILPLYSVLNGIFQNHRDEFAAAAFKTGLVAFTLYMLFSVFVLIYGTVLLRAMNPADMDWTVAATYLQLETAAFMTGLLASFTNVVFIVIGQAKNVYRFLGIRTVLSLIADFLLIPSFGVYGAAISNIFVNALLSLLCMLLLYRQKYIRFSWFQKNDAAMFLRWGKTGLFSGLQQLIDNLIYAVMVCRMVNMVAEQGNYWIANNFIWGWLLIPISALTEVIRSDCKLGYEKLRPFNYYFIAAASVMLWLVTIPVWIPFFRYAQNLENAAEIFSIVIRLLPFYIAYAGCAIIDNIFIGLGKTGCNAVTSLIINLGYYGIFYLLYRMQAILFDMNTIILMFGFGMVFHYGISLIQEQIFFRKRKQKVSH